MDSCNLSLIEFISVCNNAIYFGEKGDGKELLCDSFNRSCKPPSLRLIRSKDHKCLLLDDQKQLRASNIPKSSELDCNFFLQMYNDSTLGEQKGRAVILYINNDNENMVVCCNEKNEIFTVAMDPPSEITECRHNAVFYLMELSASNMYTFESSAYMGRFLGFELDENNPSLKKLVLCPKKSDEVVDKTEVMLCHNKST